MARRTRAARTAASDGRVTLGPVPLVDPLGLTPKAWMAAGWAGATPPSANPMTQFFAKRLAKDFAVGQELLTCTSLTDLQGVQMRYLQEMAEDYMIAWPRALLEQGVAQLTSPHEGGDGLSNTGADDHMGV